MATSLSCSQANYIGRTVPWEFAMVCGNVDPRDSSVSFMPVGSLNNKTFNLSTETSDNTTDDTRGVTSSLVTYLSLESTASGFATVEDGTLSNQAELYKYFTNQVQAGDPRRQPSLWIRVTFPDITVYAFVNITGYNRTMETTGTVSFELSVASTGTNSATIDPVIIVDTPSA